MSSWQEPNEKNTSLRKIESDREREPARERESARVDDANETDECNFLGPDSKKLKGVMGVEVQPDPGLTD